MMDELACANLTLNVAAAQAVLECPEPGLRQLVIAGGLDPKRDFRGADLRGWPLAGEDVRGFDFTGADLRGTGIEDAIMDKTTKLKGAKLDPKARKAPPPIPEDFIEQAQEMILAGKKPPAHWVPRIKRLVLTPWFTVDLAPLAGLTALQTLHCDDMPVSDLTPLAGLTALQGLFCKNTRISDLAPLANLTALQSLDCRGTQVSDLTPLAGLTALQYLTCGNTQVSDLAPLAGLTGLQRLDCSNTKVSDLTPLTGLTALRRLDCWNTQVNDLAPLSGVDRLIIRVEDETRAAVLRLTLKPGSKVRVER